MKKKTTLEDYIHALNVLDIDRDIYVEGHESIAIVPQVTITPDGRKEFAMALNANVEDGCVTDDEEVCEKAWDLLVALAGYCPSSFFEKWFEGEQAEEI